MVLSPQQMYDICRRRDSSYDGTFYMGVKTTGIYCLPSCSARTPFFQNVEFHASRNDAIKQGLRGCKRCRSEFFPNTQPNWFDLLLNHLYDNKNRKISTVELETICGVNISTIRRYFREYLDTTPAKYHLGIRMKESRLLLENGVQVADIPYSVGFNSLSGFRDAFKRYYGITPGGMKR